jgi:hypothetical protein
MNNEGHLLVTGALLLVFPLPGLPTSHGNRIRCVDQSYLFDRVSCWRTAVPPIHHPGGHDASIRVACCESSEQTGSIIVVDSRSGGKMHPSRSAGLHGRAGARSLPHVSGCLARAPPSSSSIKNSVLLARPISDREGDGGPIPHRRAGSAPAPRRGIVPAPGSCEMHAHAWASRAARLFD